jgi:hypothetical protein
MLEEQHEVGRRGMIKQMMGTARKSLHPIERTKREATIYLRRLEKFPSRYEVSL